MRDPFGRNVYLYDLGGIIGGLGATDNDGFAAMRDTASNPFATLLTAGRHWEFDQTLSRGGMWVNAPNNAGQFVPLPDAPGGYKWVDVDIAQGYFVQTLVPSMTSSPTDGSGTETKFAVGKQADDPVSVPPGGTATLGPGNYVLNLEVLIKGATGEKLRSNESATVVVPANTTLTLSNDASKITENVKGVFGVLRTSDRSEGTLTYTKLLKPTNGGMPWSDGSALFGNVLTERLKQLQGTATSGAAFKGQVGIDKTNPLAWKLVWLEVATESVVAPLTGGLVGGYPPGFTTPAQDQMRTYALYGLAALAVLGVAYYFYSDSPAPVQEA